MKNNIIFISIVVALCFAIWMASCSPATRFDNLVKKHPELFKKDTIRLKDTIKVYVFVDSSRLKKANKDFEENMDSASKNTAELQKKEPCAELANKTQKNLAQARNAKHIIDTIYKLAECRIEPYFRSDSNSIISAKIVDGKIVVDHTFRKFKYECKQKEFWMYWEFWWALSGWVIVSLIVLTRIIR